MAESTAAPGLEAGGQADGAPASADASATGATGGQAKAQQGAGSDATQSGHATETIYDQQEWERLSSALPDDLKRQAEALRKGLLSDYTRKTKTIAERKKDLELIDGFRKDPHGTIRQIANQYGYTLAEARQAVADAAQSAGGEEFQPQNWNDVRSWVAKDVISQVMKELSPFFGEVQNMKKTAVESNLDQIDPTWRQYENEMVSNLREHPTLAKDPALLYRLSVPQEVFESRAVQKALQKMELRTKASSQAASSTTKARTVIPDKPVSFAEAVEAAKAALAEQGLKKPS